jgi:predicted amidohydrolase
MQPIRVAVWQCTSHPLDVGGNLARLERAARWAADHRADVVVTPEMFTTGYAIGVDDTYRLAETPAGPTATAVADLTKRTGVAVAYGYPERGSDGRVYNAAQLIDDGRVLGRHRKIHLFDHIDLSRFAAGDAPPTVFDFRGHRVAMLICYDVEFPESVRAAAARGADLVLVPTANMVGYEIVSTTLVPARAYESGVHIAYANYCGIEGAVRYAGLSTVCPPHMGGASVLPAVGEDVLVVELHDIGGAPPYLTDRRPDLWRRVDAGDRECSNS